MGRVYDAIDDSLRRWLDRQPMFFVATAASGPDGHVNVSPKGGPGLFRVLSPRQIAYVDLVGSGVETVAHLQENGRIVVMFCAFSGPPKIFRFHGEGRIVPEGEAEFAALLSEFAIEETVRPLARGIVVVNVARISDSCGFGVPRMDLVGERDQLFRWSEQQQAKNGDDWKARYMAAKNAQSIDGLPGYEPDEAYAGLEAEGLLSGNRAL
ncbi:MAG: pyridoxamine 5'-phosphate oxidase family protein [Thermomicrobiales bacterium]|nr:pyridoxamine 5'-phosphate oxidase family protein [Thermomicrobiales bacterium]